MADARDLKSLARRGVRVRIPPRLLHNSMEHFYKRIKGWSQPADQGRLLDQILPDLPNKIKIAEIGVYLGRLTAMWNVQLINSGKEYEYFGIDHFLGPKKHPIKSGLELAQKNLKPVIDKINLIKNDSILAAKSFKDRYFDIVYIDADHEYASVKADIIAWLPKVKIGGYICGDDYIGGWPGVVKAVNEVLGRGNIKKVGQQQWFLKLTE